MSCVISFANQKGGVGKTTLCTQMAFYLKYNGFKTLVIDMDGQGNASTRIATPEETKGNTSTFELFSEGLDDISVTRAASGIDLIYSETNDMRLHELEAASIEETLRPASNTKHLFKGYDYVLIDCPPMLGRKQLAALIMSTHVVAPIELSSFAITGVLGLLETIQSIQKNFNPALKIVGIVINKMGDSVAQKEAYRDLKESASKYLFENAIGYRKPIINVTGDSSLDSIWDLNYAHVAQQELAAVFKEIMKKVKQ